MAHWNYRVVRDEHGQYAIHEAFYSDEGEVQSLTAEPVFPRADSIEELRREFQRYERALKEPVIVASDIARSVPKGPSPS